MRTRIAAWDVRRLRGVVRPSTTTLRAAMVLRLVVAAVRLPELMSLR
jgi:hypothetical protein